VQHAILAGDDVTGASVFQLVPEMDAGDVFATVREPVGRLQTAGSLLETLSHTGASLLRSVVDSLGDGTARAEPQTGEVTLAPKLGIEDGAIDWSRPADEVSNRIRGVTPEPGAYTNIDGGRLKILEAAIARDLPRIDSGRIALAGKSVLVGTATDPIELLRVHPAGRKAMDAASWWRGRAADAEALTW
jgi:methionyl-tRNA formyltransferase